MMIYEIKCQFQILVDNLKKNKKTILCFSDVYTSEKFSEIIKKLHLIFKLKILIFCRDCPKSSIQKCYHFYGMWKLKDLKIPMYYNLDGQIYQFYLVPRY